jgi:hypothetical protein
MGTSIAMIDRHYGHLANDSRDHAVALLDALAFERAVDAAWTSPQQPPRPLNQRSPRPRTAANAAGCGRSVDAAPRFCRLNRRLKSW